MSRKPDDNTDDLQAKRLEQIHQRVLATPLEVESTDPLVPNDPALADAEYVLRMIENVRRGQFAPKSLDGLGETPGPVVAETTGLSASSMDESDGGDFIECFSTVDTNPLVRTTPQSIGRFEIVRELGRGGFGMVFLANDPRLQRPVALKIPRLDALLTGQLTERFLREAKAAALLSHPHIVTVFDTGFIGPAIFVASQFVPGRNLAQWLADETNILSPRESARTVAALASAMQHAHSRGVIHRDLKPANIQVEESDQMKGSLSDCVKITDFGLARMMSSAEKLTASHAAMGTPAYMAPEQARGEAAQSSPATDIYGLGAILYELLTRKPPHMKGTLAATLRSVELDDPIPPRRLNRSVPRDLEAICLKCLEKQPSRRYASAFALETDLRRFLANEPVEARAISGARRLERWCRRQPAFAAMTAVAVAIFLVGFALVAWQWQLAEHSRLQAELRLDQVVSAVDGLLLGVAETPELKLQGFESLRRKLLEKANRFYHELVRDRPVDSALEQKHRSALFSLARIKAVLGDRDGVLELTEQLLTAMPEGLDVPREVEQQRAVLLILKARQYLHRNDASMPAATARSAVEAARRALKSSSDSPATLHDDGYYVDLIGVLSDAADLLGNVGERTAARELFEEAIAAWEQLDPQLIEANREYQAAKAVTFQRAARMYAAIEQRDKATEYLERAASIWDQMNIDPDRENSLLLDSISEGHRILGFLYNRQTDTALEHFAKASQITTHLVNRHPMVPMYHNRLAGIGYNEALAYYMSGRYDEATQRLQANIDLVETVLARFPAEVQTSLRIQGDNLALLGIVLGRLEDYNAQLEVLERSRAVNERLVRENGNRLHERLSLAGVVGSLGAAYMNLRQHDLAKTSFAESNEELEAIIVLDPANGEARRFLANNCYRLAVLAQADEDWLTAIEVIQRSIDALGERAESERYAELSTCLARSGQLDAAIVAFDRFVERAAANRVPDWNYVERAANLVRALHDSLKEAVEQSTDDAEGAGVVSQMIESVSAVTAVAARRWFAAQESASDAISQLRDSAPATILMETASWQAMLDEIN
ncbi:MAG TPA: protein kinase [Pirellulaceae bacterium]|nr:protein kinase [Pirellulaceae bacterium]HMO93024.1 protein kinase [Pirellulaceae bacterium]HMP69654.1 protein kinase [Pirellulaceae bacterium]